MIHKHFALLYLALLILLSACMSALPAASPTRSFSTGELLLEENFDVPLRVSNSWDTYDLDGVYVQPYTGSYRIRTTLGKLVYGLNREKFTNSIIEVDVTRLSTHKDAIFGVTCRAQLNGDGYYFLISPGGDFSIRRVSGSRDIALVKWQEHGAILEDLNRINRFRVACIGEYLALYINDDFVADVTDGDLSTGYTGFAAARLPDSPDAEIDVLFDDLRVFAGE